MSSAAMPNFSSVPAGSYLGSPEDSSCASSSPSSNRFSTDMALNQFG